MIIIIIHITINMYMEKLIHVTTHYNILLQ